MEKKSVLILAATDLSDNNSASLCHTAYIRGFYEAGHNVDVVAVIPTAAKYKHEIKGVNYFYFSDENCIVRTVRRNRSNITNEGSGKPQANLQRVSLKKKIRHILLSLFGATSTFSRRVYRYNFLKQYDLMISLSSPPESHEIAAELLRRRKIRTTKWCQLWEDPWSTDLYNINPDIINRERKILNKAQKIIYVSPLTLEKQKSIFEENAHKMDWLPLPTYYEQIKPKQDDNIPVFGYFGQYYPRVRNICPVYEALKDMGIQFIICGEPHGLLKETENIEIYPRLSPDELKQYEERANVLVFVSNIGGGQIPGKIYQYSGTNKPILFILDGNEYEKKVLREYFKQYNRYYFAENNIESIKNAIGLIINRQGNQVINTPIEYFKGENIANLILKMNE